VVVMVVVMVVVVVVMVVVVVVVMVVVVVPSLPELFQATSSVLMAVFQVNLSYLVHQFSSI